MAEIKQHEQVKINKLYDEYIEYLWNRESATARLFVLAKYHIIAICDVDTEMYLGSWEYGTEQEIEVNKKLFNILANNDCFATVDDMLDMHRIVIEREQYIRSKNSPLHD